jgi:hypothetical protein
MPTYLRALWCAVQDAGAGGRWESRRIESLAEVSGEHDALIVTAGAGTTGLISPRPLPVEMVHGRTLIFPNPHGLRSAILCGEYVAPGVGPEGEPILRCGATREYGARPQAGGAGSAALAEAEARLRPKLHALYPPLAEMTPLEVTAGTRVSSKRSGLGKLPIAGRLSGALWVYTGLGGRGLIHHAYVAK